MPSVARAYRNRSAELRAERERTEQKRRDSWERMKAQVAEKYAEAL